MNAINNKMKQIVTFVLANFLFSANAIAQKWKEAHKVKTEKKHIANTKGASENIVVTLDEKNFLSVISKISFIDSIVVNKDSFEKSIPLSPDCGQIGKSDAIAAVTADKETYHAYRNGYDDIRYYSAKANDGTVKLFRQEKIGGRWSKAKAVDELNEMIRDIDFPFMLADGVTLYFSGVSKDNSFGKRDIFMARLNTDSMAFYKPENIGLPYNSKTNDYMCIIDDINNLGWLVTDRRQPEGKVCIYTFIPTDERWDAQAIDNTAKLVNLAEISSIEDTQKDSVALKEAKTRLKNLQDMAKANIKSNGFPFIVNDKSVYLSIDDFKSETNKSLFAKLMILKHEYKKQMETLEKLRKDYFNKEKRNKADYKKTSDMEARTEKMAKDIKLLEKKIRNAENLL